MKLKILLLSVLAASLVQAQNYNFNNYKYRVNGFKAAGFNANLSQSSYSGNSLPTGINGNGSLDFYYNRFKNTEKQISNKSFGLNNSMDYSILQYQINGYTNLYANSETFNYRGNSFFVKSYSIFANIQKSDFEITNNSKLEQKSKRISGSYEIGFGKGRLEYISDPVMANFILKDMQKKGIINEFSSQQVEDFGKKISQVLSIRMIDFRFRLIDQIDILDSFLMKELGNSKTNAIYFTTLYDNWLYANRFQRFAGKRKQFIIGNKFDGNEVKQKFSNDSLSQRNGYFNNFYIGFQYTKENPVKLSFQRTQSIKVVASRLYLLNDYKDSRGLIEESINRFTIYYNEGFGWYSNTRNYILLNVNANLDYNFYPSLINSNSNIHRNFDFRLTPSLNYYHFFSPKLRLTITTDRSLNINGFPTLTPKINVGSNGNFRASLAYVFY